MLMEICDGNTNATGIKCSKHSCYSSFCLSWFKECKGSTDNTISTMCCWCQCQWHHMTKKSAAAHFSCLHLRNTLVILLMPSACDTDTSSTGITWPIYISFQSSLPKKCNGNILLLMASCDPNTGANGITWTKSHVAPHFHHLELTNAAVALIILLVSCNTYTNMSGITWQKSMLFTASIILT